MRFLGLWTLLLCPALAHAADLAKIDRTLKKEPTYKGRPAYFPLVFGPEAKTQVWLVLDGDTLYVDRNGNGELTEKAERVAMPPFKRPRKWGPSLPSAMLRWGTFTTARSRTPTWKLPRPAWPPTTRSKTGKGI
jgi:hypothetical protein